MPDSAVTLLAWLAVTVGFLFLALGVSFLVSDARARRKTVPTKRITLAPRPERRCDAVRREHGCDRCDVVVQDPPFEELMRCHVCGKPWTWTSVITDAAETPDEPPTQPDGPRAA